MSKRNDKNDGNGTLPAEEVEMLADDYQVTYDPITNTAYSSDGDIEPPGDVASEVIIGQMDLPPASKRSDAPDTMFAPSVRAEPNALGQPALGYPPVGTPSAAFTRPGEAIDSDGLMGTPGEWQAQRPDADQRADTDDSGTLTDVGTKAPPLRVDDFAAIGLDATPQSAAAQAQAAARQPAAPPGSPAAALAQARANGERLLGTVLPKADHRGADSGRYVTGPTHPRGTPAGPSHEVAQVDGNNMGAFIGSQLSPMPSPYPTFRVVPPEDTKGATL